MFPDTELEEGDTADDTTGLMVLGGRAALPGQVQRFGRGSVFILSVCGISACLALATARWHLSGSRKVVPVQTNTGARITFFAPLAAAALASEGVAALHYLPMVKKGLAKASDPLKTVRQEVLDSKPLDLAKYANLTYEGEFPKQRLHDGNLCMDGEESFGGLCYKRCSAITNGSHPIRTTAWSCCRQQPCSFFNSRFTNPLSLCEGFDVSRGKACPHSPGACLVNEEFNMGWCFKKCAILTNNVFPFRSAASTCCRYNSHWACLDALNTLTSPDFNVGGGGGDGHMRTPAGAHPPMLQLTEA